MAQILVVDDDLNTCQSLTAALSKEGHQVFEAHSGKEALEKIRLQEVDLAVIDLMMPGMNGLEFFQYLESPAPGSGGDYDFRPAYRGCGGERHQKRDL